MESFGMNIVTSSAIPDNTVFAVPPWVHECRIIGGVAVRYRGTETKDGKTRKVYSPLTESELKHFAVLKGAL